MAATSSRAARDSVHKPHLVLVDTLAQMCQALPKSTEEAASTRASVYKKLPSVFLAWFSLTLLPAMQRQKGQQRNEREARTLVEALDGLVKGEQLPVIMLLLGRLKALSAVVLAEGTWALAQQHELTRTNDRHPHRPRPAPRTARLAGPAAADGESSWSSDAGPRRGLKWGPGHGGSPVLWPNAEARAAGAENPKGEQKGGVVEEDGETGRRSPVRMLATLEQRGPRALRGSLRRTRSRATTREQRRLALGRRHRDCSLRPQCGRG